MQSVRVVKHQNRLMQGKDLDTTSSNKRNILRMVMVSWCDCVSRVAHVTLVMEKGPPEQHDLRTHCHRLRLAGLCLDQPLLFRGFWVMGCQKGLWQGLSAQVTKLLMS